MDFSRVYHDLKSLSVKLQYSVEDHKEGEIDTEELKKELRGLAKDIQVFADRLEIN